MPEEGLNAESEDGVEDALEEKDAEDDERGEGEFEGADGDDESEDEGEKGDPHGDEEDEEEEDDVASLSVTVARFAESEGERGIPSESTK